LIADRVPGIHPGAAVCKVLDHIIVAGGETMSFAERGMI